MFFQDDAAVTVTVTFDRFCEMSETFLPPETVEHERLDVSDFNGMKPPSYAARNFASNVSLSYYPCGKTLHGLLASRI